MKYIVHISRFVVGIIFILSGFVKAVDPIGFGYKLEEYFAPDVFNIGFLHDLALPQATFFSIFEIILGVLLIIGIFRKFTVWSLLVLIVFFTFLTFYSAYFNKVTDCGCFGDAMKLTPWQSFWKDIFLLVLILVLFVGQKHIRPFIKNKVFNYGVTAIAFIISAWISFVGISKLPLIDFRAYAIGKNIPESMKTAEELGLQAPIYRVYYTMKNQNSGEIIKITDEDFVSDPKWYEEGTPWKVQLELTETKLIADGYTPPIHDFILDCEEGDMTDYYLEQPKVVFFIVPFPNKVNHQEFQHLNQLHQKLTSQGVVVTALTNVDIDSLEFSYCFLDQTILKTIIRSNPGILVLEKGIVVNKFHNNPLPSSKEILKSFQ